VVFDRLREAMRIAPVGGEKGLNDDGTEHVMTTIREGVELFRSELDIESKPVKDRLTTKMAGWNHK